MRNRWAVASVLVVFLVATIAVFCPLIANSRPYMIEAVLEVAYEDAYFVALDLGERAVGHGDDSVLTRADLSTKMRGALATVAQMTPEDLQPRLRELSAILKDASPSDGEAYAQALAAFEAEFDYAVVDLQPARRYPVFTVLTRNEIWWMWFYVLALPAIGLRARIGGLWRGLAGAAILAIVATTICTTVWPRVTDNFPYRNLIESPEFAEAGGKVWQCLVPYGENENITSEARQPPTFLLPVDQRTPTQRFHLFGTDTNGRDVLSRMIYGARVSMLVGIVAVSIYVVIGVLLGAAAGYFGGWTDLLLSRIIEIVICFPVLFLLLSVQAFLNPSIINIMVALGLVSWTGVARLQRGEFIRLVGLDFVQGVRALGGGHLRIIFAHILPNAIAPILVLASFGIAGSILVESTLSFLGFGVPQPTASWGDLLNNGRNDIQGTWWLTVFPGLAIFLTVTCFNLVGEGVRDALDPRRRH
jgi:peptide/nickel transport system permease protein